MGIFFYTNTLTDQRWSATCKWHLVSDWDTGHCLGEMYCTPPAHLTYKKHPAQLLNYIPKFSTSHHSQAEELLKNVWVRSTCFLPWTFALQSCWYLPVTKQPVFIRRQVSSFRHNLLNYLTALFVHISNNPACTVHPSAYLLVWNNTWFIVTKQWTTGSTAIFNFSAQAVSNKNLPYTMDRLTITGWWEVLHVKPSYSRPCHIINALPQGYTVEPVNTTTNGPWKFSRINGLGSDFTSILF